MKHLREIDLREVSAFEMHFDTRADEKTVLSIEAYRDGPADVAFAMLLVALDDEAACKIILPNTGVPCRGVVAAFNGRVIEVHSGVDHRGETRGFRALSLR